MVLSVDAAILLILIFFSGFFSSAEAALFSLTDLHLHEMKSDNQIIFEVVGISAK